VRDNNTQYIYGVEMFGLAVLDQLLKCIFSVYSNTLVLVPNLVSFSISQEDRFMGWLLIDSLLFPVTVYMLVLAIIYWNKNFFYQRPYALVFLLAGITSNFLDRVFLGYVRDYITVEGLVSFNLADGMIVVGVGLLLTSILFKTNNQ